MNKAVLRRPRKSWWTFASFCACGTAVAILLSIGPHRDARADFGSFDIGPLHVDTDVSHWDPTHFVPHVIHEQVFKQAEDNLEKIANDTLAKSDALLTKHEQLAAELLGKQQHVLSGYLTEANSTLRGGLQNSLEELREMTSFQTSGLVLYGKVFALNCTGAAGVFLLLAALCGLFYAFIAYGSGSTQVKRAAALASAAVLACAVLYGFRSYRIWAYEHGYKDSYAKDLSGLHLNALVEHATYLKAIENADFSTERISLSVLMRDVLTKPWSYSAAYDGYKSLAALRELESTYAKRCAGKDNPYALALDAFVEWQLSADRVGEYRSAEAAARALQGASIASPSAGECWPEPTGNFSLAFLATHYLKTYLSHPLTAEEFAANDIKPQIPLEQLSSISRSYQKNTAPIEGLKSFSTYGDLVSDLLCRIGPAYTVLAYSNAMAAMTTGKVHNGYLAAALAAATRIVTAYDGTDASHPGFIGALQAEEFKIRRSPAIQVALRDPHVFYYRASQLLQAQPKDCLDHKTAEESYQAVRTELLGANVPPQMDAISCVLKPMELIPDGTPFATYKGAHAAVWDSLITTRLFSQHIDGSLEPAMYDFIVEDSFANLQRAVAELDSAEKAIAALLTARNQFSHQPTARDDLIKAIASLSKSRVTTRLFVCPGDAASECGDKGTTLLSALTRHTSDAAVQAATRDALHRQSAFRDLLVF